MQARKRSNAARAERARTVWAQPPSAGHASASSPPTAAADAWASDGRLAATLAHEVNNSLDTIQNCLHLLSGKVRTRGAPAYELLRGETARLSRLVRETLGLYRNSQPAAPSDLNAAVAEALHALQPRLRRAEVRVTASRARLPRLVASPVLMRLLVSNLITNAADAMPTGGRLRVETRMLRSRRVRLRVSDTGAGIPPKLASRIFQPFVTSKGERGTGLGLWIVAQIAAHHGGRVRALPRRGGGTVMEVELPVSAVGDDAT